MRNERNVLSQDRSEDDIKFELNGSRYSSLTNKGTFINLKNTLKFTLNAHKYRWSDT
jgi:hypothetical protein